MVESQVALGWINQGEAKAKIHDLLRLLEKKFPPGAAGEMLASLDEFRKAMTPRLTSAVCG